MTKKIHPFEEWFQKTQYKLVKGKDFACQPHSMAQQIRNAATKMNLPQPSIMIEGKVLMVTNWKNAK